jgi:hypothetical protein
MSTPTPLPGRVRFAKSVRVRLGADTGFLFEQRSGRVYSLNATAALAAARIQTEEPPVEIVSAVVDAFDVDAGSARRDLARFIADLRAEGLADLDG